MFTIKPKTHQEDSVSQLALLEISLGVFGVAVPIAMLVSAFSGTASETTGKQSSKALKSKTAV